MALSISRPAAVRRCRGAASSTRRTKSAEQSLIVESMISMSPALLAYTTPPLLLPLPLIRVSPRRVRLQPFPRVKSLVCSWPSSVAPSPLLATVTLMLEPQLIWLPSLKCALGGR